MKIGEQKQQQQKNMSFLKGTEATQWKRGKVNCLYLHGSVSGSHRPLIYASIPHQYHTVWITAAA